ncbi:hypothetical protein K280104A7_23670 [Candidatus Bariatricus faecipullorum]
MKIWKTEAKICLPFYKLASSLAFLVILAFIRPVVFAEEIGPAMESPVAFLAAALGADTWAGEITGGRTEILRLSREKEKLRAVLRRYVIQNLWLFGAALAGYGLFYWQRPETLHSEPDGLGLFALYAAAIPVTLLFWSAFSMTVCTLVRSIWPGLALLLAVLVGLTSKAGEELLGNWNLFSYACRDLETGDIRWLYGKGVSLALTAALLLLLPGILRKRG